MSDKKSSLKLGLKDTLKLAPKIALPKNEPNVEATDIIVQKLHAEVPLIEPPVSPPPPPPIVKTLLEEPIPSPINESRRITLDIPLDLYKQMKRRVFDDGVTLKKYILELVKDDLTK